MGVNILPPAYFDKSGKRIGRLAFEQMERADKRRKEAIKKAAIVGGSIALIGGAALVGLGAAGAGAAGLLAKAGSVAAKAGSKAVKGMTLKKAAVGLTAAGILVSSKKARSYAANAPKTLFEKGKTIGNIIEEPSKIKDVLGISGDKSLKENVLSAAKKVGIAGAATGAVLGTAAIVGKKIKDKIAQAKEEKLNVQSPQLLSSTVSPKILEPNPFANLGVVPTASNGMPQASQSNLSPRPINNIIQISVR